MVLEAEVRSVGEGGGVLSEAEAAWGASGEAVGRCGGFVGGREWRAGWVRIGW